jgi:polyhydroxyalkanoate synthase
MSASEDPQSRYDPAIVQQQLQARLLRLTRSAVQTAPLLTSRKGLRLGQTPRERIWTLNKCSLYRYYPQVAPEQRRPVPLLLIFALINRPYIFDLRPGHSFIEYMLQQGYDVYLLDWGVPGPEDAGLDFSDYTLDYLPRALRKLRSNSGSSEFSILGWCIGATIATMYAAACPDKGLRNLILLTAPLDFSDRRASAFHLWLDEAYFDVDHLVQYLGNIPAPMIDVGGKLIKPVENYVTSYVKLWDNIDRPEAVAAWRAMHAWVNDSIPFAGAAFRQWVVEFFREDRLMQGRLMLKGQPIHVESIAASLLNVIATQDHIVPNCQSLSIMDRVGSSDKTLIESRSGHIGIMAGSGARRRVWPRIDTWLAARST